jgi:isopenicillin N synthase-like dioxygenase
MEAPIELSDFLQDPNSQKAKEECKRLANLFSRMGAVTVRDPRVTFENNQYFIDMIEDYMAQPEEVKYKDVRKELGYQIGATPEGTELPRCASDPTCKDRIEKMAPENRPLLPTGPDVKWRFFHRLGSKPAVTEFPQLNCPEVIPEGFPQWQEKMDNWGKKLLDTAFTLAEMAAVGFDLPRNTFTDLIHNGPHLLAPTASDLNKYGRVGQILAGYHQDLNFITLHGKSRYPGLFIWLREGKKLPVSIPDGCLLAQAGMQFEHLTGGLVMPGFHEVVVTEKTLEAMEAAKNLGRPLWRISSTVFIHVASDNILRPLLNTDGADRFKPIKAGLQVENELKAIELIRQ